MIHVVRLSAVQITFLPIYQSDPQASTIIAGRLAAGHNRNSGITTLNQRLGALLVWSHDARSHQLNGDLNGGSSLVSFRRRACSYPVSIRNRNSRPSSRLSRLRSLFPISSMYPPALPPP